MHYYWTFGRNDFAKKRRLARGHELMAVAISLTACDMPGAWDVWYVATTGDNNNNCLSVENACLTIQAAIDKAGVNGSIFIAAGTYDSFWINPENGVDKQLHLLGAGPSRTIITSNFMCIVRVNHESSNVTDRHTI